MTKRYEELRGGEGREVNFRAERFVIRRFLQHQTATAVVNGKAYPIHDISMNGLSLAAPKGGELWRVDDVLPIVVRVTGVSDAVIVTEGTETDVYIGAARVARATPTEHRLRVGLELQEGFLDLPRIRWEHEEDQLSHSLTVGPPQILDGVPADYRMAVEQAISVVQFYRHLLGRHEQRCRRGVDASDAGIRRLVEGGVASMEPRWNQVRLQAAKAILPHMDDPTTLKAAKRYTETLLTPLLLACPLLARAYEKPMGYAGDYKTMLMIYRDAMEGPTAFDRVMHKIVNGQAITRGARNRTTQMKTWIAEEYRRHTGAAPSADFSVTNLGSGPALEVAEFVRDNREWTSNINWTLVDQDEDALSFAFGEIFPPLSMTTTKSVVRCRYVSFGQMLRRPELVFAEGPQQLIYSVGLFDYLPQRAAKRLIEALYGQLRPGGLLVIGNAAWPFDYFWEAEFVTDWSLLYRTREQMHDLVDAVPGAEAVEVLSEPCCAFSFLRLRKPRA